VVIIRVGVRFGLLALVSCVDLETVQWEVKAGFEGTYDMN
jgi:hypothetical protein